MSDRAQLLTKYLEAQDKEFSDTLNDCVFDIIDDLSQRKYLGEQWQQLHPLERQEIANRWHTLLCRRFEIDEP